MKVKGLIHCHSRRSFDSALTLDEITAQLLSEGFRFAVMTEHAVGIGGEDYSKYVNSCKELSDESFVFIPGLELLCELGTEILGIGLEQLVTANKAKEIISKIHEQGGYTILAHPWKRHKFTLFPERLGEIDAIELQNAKEDGTAAPPWELMRAVRGWTRAARSKHVIYGADMHGFTIPRRVWLECELPQLSEGDILKSLKAGSYRSRSVGGTIGSRGPTRYQSIVYVVMRSAYLVWNAILQNIPPVVALKLSQLLSNFLKIFEKRRST
jgi:hypothetical protein